MGETVAVVNAISAWGTGLKREALFFDKFYLIHSRGLSAANDVDPARTADMSWLIDRGVALPVNTNDYLLSRDSAPLPPEVTELHRKLGEANQDVSRLASQGGYGRYSDLLCRIVAGHLIAKDRTDAYAICREFPQATDSPHTVLRVAMSALPLPDASTSWEAILDFRKDPEARLRMRRFKRWIDKLAVSGANEKELTEELDWAVEEYEHYMNVIGIGVTRGLMEMMVVAPLEIIEDLVKFRWSKLAKLAFGISKPKVDLLQAELKAPGRECAYVLSARTRFRNR